jgi:MoxR-like ATPase
MARNFRASPLANHVVFLDEIEKAGEHVQQALFSLLNASERMIIDSGREFDFGGIESLIATRNYELDDPAFSDRFSACIEMEDLSREHPDQFLGAFFDMIGGGAPAKAPSYSSETIAQLRARASQISKGWRAEHRAQSELWQDYCTALKKIAKAYPQSISGRKNIQLHKLVCAWGAMQDREVAVPQTQDIWALQYGFLDGIEAKGVRSILHDLLGMSEQSEHPLLPWPTTAGADEATLAQYRSDVERLQAQARRRK